MPRNSSYGQTSLEFLFSVGMALLVFAMSTMLFLQSQSDAAAMESYLDSKAACQEVAGKIAAVYASGDGTQSYLRLPLVSGGLDYTVAVSGVNRTVSISHAGGLVACRIPISNVSNGTANVFYATNGAAVRNIDGGVLVG